MTTLAPPIFERVDIHKSCKALEVMVNALSDYCEAAMAVASVQKKLAKALREVANAKATGEIAGENNFQLYIVLALIDRV